MPSIETNGCKLYYEETGEGDETIVFSHGLLWSTKMFQKQIDLLKDRFHIIAYDHRGQGQSEVPQGNDDITVEHNYEDAVALIENLKLGQVHWVGLSMGGFTGIRVAARRPELIKSLVLIATGAFSEPNFIYLKNMALVLIVQAFGVSVVTEQVMKVMFAKAFLQDDTKKDEVDEWKAEYNKNTKSVLRSVKGIIKRKGNEYEVEKITCPTLILVGEDDVSQPVKCSEFLYENIQDSELQIIKDCGHTASVEQPEEVSKHLREFYNKLTIK